MRASGSHGLDAMKTVESQSPAGKDVRADEEEKVRNRYQSTANEDRIVSVLTVVTVEWVNS